MHVVLLEKASHTPGNVCEETSEWIVAELKITDENAENIQCYKPKFKRHESCLWECFNQI